ncbi:site-specific DNA-methyltransferase [uncultured Corynebacterium sp.]|uniref:site-specific DNA-methyltransferase n=1 Tax=uncultured Corynebacterium sp. TaxID=159447 RepID=UPI00259B4EDE|nr:site-specific DNA-methyltransferase [uncultured Corynebacterium sp.]
MRAAQTPTTATLRPDKENSKDWDTTKNVFIEGDNLEVLKILQKHYHGKIKMIYIDPPYNTGKDFVYPDNYKEGLETYLKWSKQVNEDGKKLSSNSETEGRYHSNWLNMMYPRLKLARNLLTDDGFIFVSIDEHEYNHLKRVMDEIFGESNYRNTLTVRRRVKSLNSQFAERGLTSLNIGTESVLVYSRSTRSVLQPVRVAKKNAPAKGRWDVFWSGADRPTMRYELLGFTPQEGQWRNSREKALQGVRNYEKYLHEFSEKESLEDYSKRTGIKKFIRRIPNGTGKNGGVQHWVAPTNTKLRSSLWTDLEVSQIKKEIDLPFENPKSRLLIQELISLVNLQDEDMVLDFFAGSATSAHSVLQLNALDSTNRRFIMIQLPEPTAPGSDAHQVGFGSIADISRERIRRAAKIIEASNYESLDLRNKPLDVGFRSYRLADTNFTKWRTDSDIDATQLEQHLLDLRESADDDATPDDLLTEILLKQGHSLVEQIRDRDIDGLPYKAVVRVDDEDGEEDTLVLAYLDEHAKPTLAQLRTAMEVKPAQFIMLEDVFQGDDELKTNLAQICKTNGIELWTA